MADRTPSLTTAEQFLAYALRGTSLPGVPGTCLLVHSRALIHATRERFPHHTVDIGARARHPVHLVHPEGGEPFGMVFGGLGAPAAVVGLEVVIAVGFERFWNIGTTGHPTGRQPPELQIGDLLLVDEALIYEGTSAHYGVPAGSVRADPDLCSALGEVLGQRGVAFRTGAVATTDALFRETPEFVAEIRRRGVLGIDMEASALLTVARAHGLPLGVALVVSDHVGPHTGWRMGLADLRVDAAERVLLDALIDCVGAR